MDVVNKVPTRLEVMEKEYFSKGLAVCAPNIVNDTIYFKFRDEEFEFPSYLANNLVTYNNSSYDSAPVKKLRALEKKNGLRKRA